MVQAMLIHEPRPEWAATERPELFGAPAAVARDQLGADPAPALARERGQGRGADILVLVPHRLPAVQPAVAEPWSPPMDDVGYAERVAVLFCIGVWALLITLCVRALLLG